MLTLLLTILGCIGLTLLPLKASDCLFNLALYFFIINLNLNRFLYLLGFLILDVININLAMFDALTFALLSTFVILSIGGTSGIPSLLFATLFTLTLLLLFCLLTGMSLLIYRIQVNLTYYLRCIFEFGLSQGKYLRPVILQIIILFALFLLFDLFLFGSVSFCSQSVSLFLGIGLYGLGFLFFSLLSRLLRVVGNFLARIIRKRLFLFYRSRVGFNRSLSIRLLFNLFLFGLFCFLARQVNLTDNFGFINRDRDMLNLCFLLLFFNRNSLLKIASLSLSLEFGSL